MRHRACASAGRPGNFASAPPRRRSSLRDVAASSCGASSTSAMRCAELLALELAEAARGDRRASRCGCRDVTNGFSGSFGIAFLLTVMCARAERRLGVLAGDLLRAQVDQEHVGVGAAGHDAQAALLQHLRQHARVLEHLLLVDLEVARQRFPNATALAAITCISGPPCRPGNTAELIAFSCSRVGEDEAAARAAQRLVRGAGDEVGDADRASDRRPAAIEAGVVRHVDHQQRADAVGDRAKALPVDHARIRRRAGDDQLGLVLVREPLGRVVVDELGLGIEAVGDDVEPLAATC